MPYNTNEDLPESIQDALPDHAQTIFRKAFNSASEQYGTEDEARLMKVAWAAVKKVYEKKEDKWVVKEGEKAVSELFVDKPQISGDWIPIAKVGQIMSLSSADKNKSYKDISPTAGGLEMAAGLFNDIGLNGYVNKNHSGVIEGLRMLKQKFEEPFLYAKFNPEAEAAIKDPNSNGRSIEASVFCVNDKDEATHLLVTGVSVLDGIHVPACTPQMGCASAPRAEGSSADFDLATINNAGQTVKIRDIYLYLEKGEKKNEKMVKDRLVAEVAYIGYQTTCLFFKHDSKLRIGDVVSEDSKPLHTVQIAISAKGEVKSTYHEGGGIKNMEKEGKVEAVTYTGEQTKEMVATAVSEITEKLDNAHAVELTKLKDEEEVRVKEAEAEREKAIVTAQEEAFKHAQARATFVQKFGLKDDSEVMKQYDDVKTVIDMQSLVNSMEIPMATSSTTGISTAKGEEESKVDKIEEIGSYDPMKGEWVPTYREEVKE